MKATETSKSRMINRGKQMSACRKKFFVPIGLYTTILFISLVSLWAQSTSPYKLLKPGDPVPDIMLQPVLNYPANALPLATYSDKLLVLYFWSTSCVPCVAKFPQLDAFQRKYNNQLLMLPVTPEDSIVIEPFFSRIVRNKNLILPTATNSDINLAFIEEGVWSGSFAWIRNGILLEISSDMNDDLINRILKGVPTNQPAPVRLPEINNFDQPILDAWIKGEERIRSSLFTTRQPNLRPEVKFKTANEPHLEAGLRFINISLGTLYRNAYDFPPLQIRWEVPNTANRIRDSLVCYELLTYGKDLKGLMTILQHDLQATFGFTVTREIRKTNVLVLKRKSKIPASAGETPEQSASVFHLNLVNLRAADIMHQLKISLTNPAYPMFIDKSRIHPDTRLDLQINADMNNPQAVNRELQTQGLRLIIKQKKLPIYTIR